MFWVTSSSDVKLQHAIALGADEALNNRSVDIAKAIRSKTNKRGVDVVIDSVGQATWSSSLGALGKAGRLVTCGATSGPTLETDARRLFWNQWSIMGSTMGNDAEFHAVVQPAFPRPSSSRPSTPSSTSWRMAAPPSNACNSGDQFGKIVIRIADR